MKIIVDHRESSSNVIREIYKLDHEIKTEQLEVGDFIISEKIGIERKTTRDFLDSLIDGRLLEQAKNLAENYEKPIIILEGQGLYNKRQIHPNAVRGALSCITIDFGIPIIPSENMKDTAKIISQIAKRKQKDKDEDIPVRKERKALTLPQMQRFVIEGLPGVSATLAKRLLKHFKTIKNIIEASKNKLTEVEGIGEKKSRKIKKILETEYEEKNNE